MNDSDGPDLSARVPGAAGAAAILLVESLLHALVERSVLDIGTALDVVQTSLDVIGETDADTGDPSGMLSTSRALLERIATSMRLDLPDTAP